MLLNCDLRLTVGAIEGEFRATLRALQGVVGNCVATLWAKRLITGRTGVGIGRYTIAAVRTFHQ